MRTKADRIEVDPHHGGDGLTQARAPRFGILLLAMLALTPLVIMATGTGPIGRIGVRWQDDDPWNRLFRLLR
jgi:hypothetical protein